ncbi:Bis(5'-nucleosyl)-tetraphosphatase (asymmetrical) (EC [Bathymodiolus thermophilus thioautotrophic gill symbiont]|jgi:histidine triad (HIT) family protein|uniref:HIT family hydrolase n=3 Tax=sulfur-oxidizing symbionts TaxID=32036 RepID=A0A1H6LIK6_9GAMM|nr:MULTISPECIES: histidine triad nucleotide-binding protein [sulfur-oxidizing symbionts]CAC9510272.1 Bis(5'-nucleosyl)-tetraphosphatase (asymmetrical) (EC 3.6.1.17) [uncultured Gammaproteobacteria bacterium]CAB5504304.1 Bis(5'-nucleosyl)-tetraphosphatase (asymmetrical) (EC [Bathymodiolus azoricus thioautotrophic gill symbiont]CAB5504407.1 Bis(5'-nucleosyl)-tetraphosphatase (asymmetrical) (EC [Bathymodiolus thermophilus thioautotrophic gill symbiont]CAC9532171.1 Bis(5'-nucleosyl)-tetraphosphatas
MSDCLFCKIIAGDIPTEKIYEDAEVLAFHDIRAQAPHHFLVIPKKHIASLNTADDAILIGKLSLTASKIAKDLCFADEGYRVVMNCNANGGQTVYHIHLHCLGGRALSWPPG